MNDPIRVFSMVSCPFAQRTRIVLRAKGVPYELTEIDLTKPRTPEFLALNPSGKVPVILHGARALHESSIINEYLEEVLPEPRLFPAGPHQRAQARVLVDYCNTTFAPLMYRVLMEQEAQQRAKVVRRADDSWRWLDARLREVDPQGPHAFGAFGIVEATYAPFLQRYVLNDYYWGYTVPPGLDRLQAWRTAVLANAHAAATAMDDQDCIKMYADYSRGYGIGKIPPGQESSALDLSVPLAQRPMPARRAAAA